MASEAISQTGSVPKRNRKLWVRLLSIVMTVGLMGLVLSLVEWGSFGDLVGRVSLVSLLIAATAYFMQNVFRALRFRILLDRRETPMRLLLPITLYHNFLVRVLPFKLGELSYIMLLRNRLNYSVESGVSSLFGARLLEMLMVLLVCTVGIVFSGEVALTGRDTLFALILLSFVAGLALIYFAGPLTRTFAAWLRRLLPDRAANADSFFARLLVKLDSLAEQFDLLRQPRLFASALFLSVFTNGSAIVLNFTLLRAVGVDVSFAHMLAIIGIGQFAIAFPFSVSGFGVVEMGWALGLVAFSGLTANEAASVGLLLHSFQVAASTVYGIIGYLIVRLQPDQPRASGQLAADMPGSTR